MMVMVHFSQGARFDCRYIHMASALYDGGFLQQKRSEKRVDYFRRKKEKKWCTRTTSIVLYYIPTRRHAYLVSFYSILVLLSFG